MGWTIEINLTKLVDKVFGRRRHYFGSPGVNVIDTFSSLSLMQSLYHSKPLKPVACTLNIL